MSSDLTTYQIRLSASLLQQFRAAAKQEDRSPAGEIRAFMRDYVALRNSSVDDDQQRWTLALQRAPCLSTKCECRSWC